MYSAFWYACKPNMLCKAFDDITVTSLRPDKVGHNGHLLVLCTGGHHYLLANPVHIQQIKLLKVGVSRFGRQ